MKANGLLHQVLSCDLYLNEMMNDITIHIDSLEVSGYQSITGIIYVKIGCMSFPDDCWNDLAGSVLDMWLDAATEFLEEGFRGRCCLYFMDGPYYIHMDARKAEGHTVQVYLEKGGANPVNCGTVDFPVFVRHLLATAEMLCESVQMDENAYAISHLKHSIQRLRQVAEHKGIPTNKHRSA